MQGTGFCLYELARFTLSYKFHSTVCEFSLLSIVAASVNVLYMGSNVVTSKVIFLI
jgi:hypothetical protein